jgi:hypothetical protein
MTHGEKLWQEIAPAFLAPSNSTIENSVRAVGELPGIDTWNHGVKRPADAMRIVRWGLPLHMIRSERSFNDLRTRISHEIRARGAPTEADLSECEAAGLLVLLGARVEYLEQSGERRVPDLLSHWADGEQVEVEVTLAEEKYTQRTRRDAVILLGEALEGLNLPYDLFVHILDTISPEEQKNIVAAAAMLSAGTIAQQPERWHIRAESIPHRDPSAVYVAGQDHQPPEWFSREFAIPFSVRGILATPDQRWPNPRVHIYWGLSTTGYMNPLEKKASRFQGSGTRPFIVAIDAASIPGARRFYEENLGDWFSLWDHVSGVLVFELQTNMVSKIFWTWQFLENPHARMPVKQGLREVLKPGVWETGLSLYT